ncbi:hypothetical protein RHMOL_Rhmol09G0083800 [Rhododendron molle]|uniref:Uncharacterized protein n=1 Tax=Rhododendron molle TaxID=49168 RepID=A0ACC0MB02_RHOML|nr:hypothetical protein RHMOL_Rhmol09G0083800 [Rhododendron molle]
MARVFAEQLTAPICMRLDSIWAVRAEMNGRMPLDTLLGRGCLAASLCPRSHTLVQCQGSKMGTLK